MQEPEGGGGVPNKLPLHRCNPWPFLRHQSFQPYNLFMEKGPVEYRLEDVVRLRKPHACGGFEWRVVRLGADIGLECQTCKRRVLLERRELEKRTKTFVSRGPADAPLTPPVVR